jgi:AraC-like DNA-binding protein
MQTLVQLRIEQSQSLLMRGYKLDDIAGQCGFYDAAHFSRAFQAKTGQTPRRFARTLGG